MTRNCGWMKSLACNPASHLEEIRTWMSFWRDPEKDSVSEFKYVRSRDLNPALFGLYYSYYYSLDATLALPNMAAHIDVLSQLAVPSDCGASCAPRHKRAIYQICQQPFSENILLAFRRSKISWTCPSWELAFNQLVRILLFSQELQKRRSFTRLPVRWERQFICS